MLNHWVEEIFGRYNLLDKFSEQSVLSLWKGVVGDRISKLTRAERFSNGVLHIAVSSSVVAQELSFLKERYRSGLNTGLGKELVDEIRFIPGRFENMTEAVPAKALSNSDFEEARRLFYHIDDLTLRGSFERLYLTLRKREEELLAKGGRRCPSCGAVFLEPDSHCPGCRFDKIESGRETD
jgi:predicted Zn-ribbon and HTH transcriptional regulator